MVRYDDCHSHLLNTQITCGQAEGFTFHDTRRTAITEMLEVGIPFPAIQSRTGQTRKRVLQYAQPMRSSKLRSAKVLEGRFGGQPEAEEQQPEPGAGEAAQSET